MSLRPINEIIDEYYDKYDSIKRVKCKILNSYVYFTSEGRIHLLYKNNRKKRSLVEQKYKLKLFPLVIPVIKYSTKIQDWRFNNSKDVQYYAIVGKVGRSMIEIRVIVKRTGCGQFNFHSVMENKKSRKKRD